MTAFRLESVRLDTVEGPVTHNFDRDLTVLAGPTGVGKTTLFELIKHGFGGNGELSPVAEDSVTDVHLTVRIGGRRLLLSRATASDQRKKVRVADLGRGDRLEDHYIDTEPRVSDLLMTALGLPTDARAAAAGSSTRAGNRISFNDVFRFMYVSQDVMNRSIAGSDDSNLDLKRRTTFELMFGIVTTKMLDLRSRINLSKGEIVEAQKVARTARDILRSSGTTGRQEAQIGMDKAIAAEQKAEHDIAFLRNELGDFIDSRTQTLRLLLADAERELSDIAATTAALRESKQELQRERQRLDRSRARLARTAVAMEVVGLIEFVTCPRCTQALDQRAVPHGACPVCLQPDPKPAGQQQPASAEIARLDEQISELEQQSAAVEEQSARTQDALTKREGLVARLSKEIDERTADQVTPRLQRYADAVGQREGARAEQKHFEALLRQWDREQDIAQEAERLQREQAQMKMNLRTLEDHATDRRRELVAMLEEAFADVVGQFGIPTVEKVSIDAKSYLPILNGKRFSKISKAGGIITLTQIAYWLTVNTVALRQAQLWKDVHYPAFLLIDTPRLALGDQEALADRIYTRFQTQVAAWGEGAQIIIADNAPPSNLDSRFREITFDYDNPTVSTIQHPGPATVDTLFPDATGD